MSDHNWGGMLNKRTVSNLGLFALGDSNSCGGGNDGGDQTRDVDHGVGLLGWDLSRGWGLLSQSGSKISVSVYAVVGISTGWVIGSEDLGASLGVRIRPWVDSIGVAVVGVTVGVVIGGHHSGVTVGVRVGPWVGDVLVAVMGIFVNAIIRCADLDFVVSTGV